MALSIRDIEHLAILLERSGLGGIEIEDAGQRLKITLHHVAFSGTSAHSPMNIATTSAGTVVKAEVAGIYVARHPWRENPFVQLGQAVTEGELVGLVKVGRIYTPIPSPATGSVVEILVETGTAIGFGTPIITIK
ncbi:acetyl-CoA carboxylase biotin carboxyl carrier protein [Chelatococcus asaccharovorans]|uniref:Biotin carboxyl carrier protein n=1 Tax=Chelatococcus asaccharovorans TaxID=28210 RepID=A0A2V3U5D1_9HYPH|nr:biotin/lipoyl-containing protein [Chelatococcus asaccharovorans]MBS7702804.1 hypothetical protein [Chelatococcus asaccharovorans]PXW57096.1 biotin carboxyl carrier protein [Chelatococcus asaccharovorans]